MTPLSEAIIAILTPFAPLFTRPVWGHVQVLLIGAILPKPKKGQRLRPLSKRLGEVRVFGKAVCVRWYGGQRKTLRILSNACLWHTAGFAGDSDHGQGQCLVSQNRSHLFG